MELPQRLREEIIDLLLPLLDSEGVTLVDCQVAVHKSGRKIILALDREGGMNVDDYARWTRYLEDVLAGELPDLGAFRLEVGSPGLERILRSELELSWARGRRVAAKVQPAADSGETVVGELRDFDPYTLTLQPAAGPERKLDREEVVQLRLHHEWPKQFRRRDKRSRKR
jgi:ribosome maturation factor RimP